MAEVVKVAVLVIEERYGGHLDVFAIFTVIAAPGSNRLIFTVYSYYRQ